MQSSQKAGDFDALGQAKAVAFLEQLPDLQKVLAMDVEAAYEAIRRANRSTK